MKFSIENLFRQKTVIFRQESKGMRNLSIIIVLCLLTACNWTAKREEKTQKLVAEEMKAIDWDDLDQYPLFADCDELVSKPEQRDCFMQTLLSHFADTLRESDFVLVEAIEDTIFVDFRMEDTGAISLLNIKNDEKVSQQLPGFRNEIEKSLNSLPKIAPPLKRGIPVSAKFRIPIVLQ